MLLKNVNKKLALALYIIFGAFLLADFVTIVKERPLRSFFSPNSNTATIQWTIFIISVFIGVGLLIYLTSKIVNKINIFGTKLSVFILMVLTVIPRAIWISLVNVLPQSDFLAYHKFANLIIEGKVAGNTYISLFPHYLGYSSFLSGFYKIFGSEVIVAQILNVLICCGITALIYIIGKRVFGNEVGIFAALIMVFWPSQVFYVVLISTEALYTFLLLLSVYLFIRILDSKSSIGIAIIMLIILGMECAITNSIRPFGVIMLTAMGIYYLFFYKQNFVILKSVLLSKSVCLAAMFIGYVVLSSGITGLVHSAVKKDIPKFPAGFNMYVGANYKSEGTWNIEDANTLMELIKKPGSTPQETHNELIGMAIERVKQYSIKTDINLIYNKFKTMWAVDHDSLVYIKAGLDKSKPSRISYEKYERLLVKISNYYYYAMLILCAIGVVCLLKRKEINKSLLLILLALGIASAHIILEVAGRYHYPAMSIFSLIASFGLVNARQIKRAS